jgi:hypothetical protein
MPLRRTQTVFLVTRGNGEPLGIYRGAPNLERLAGAEPAGTVAYDLGELGPDEYARLLAALAAFRELPYLADGAPRLLFVRGVPSARSASKDKRSAGGRGMKPAGGRGKKPFAERMSDLIGRLDGEDPSGEGGEGGDRPRLRDLLHAIRTSR